MVIGITGADGFVGRHLVRIFAERGDRVVAFVRSGNSRLGAIERRHYEMDNPPAPSSFQDIDVLIHAAFIRATVATAADTADQNIEGTLALHAAVGRAGVRFVYLSSLSARADATSSYGMHKYAIESQLSSEDAIIVRPGLIVGDGGLLRSLFTMLSRRLVPLVDSGRQATQVLGPEDLVSAIDIAVRNRLSGPLNVCADQSVTVSHIASSMAARFDLHPRFVDVPWRLAFIVAAVAERFRVTLPITTENLLGMRSVTPALPSPLLRAAGWKAHSWDELLSTLEFRR